MYQAELRLQVRFLVLPRHKAAYGMPHGLTARVGVRKGQMLLFNQRLSEKGQALGLQDKNRQKRLS